MALGYKLALEKQVRLRYLMRQSGFACVRRFATQQGAALEPFGLRPWAKRALTLGIRSGSENLGSNLHS